MASGTQDTSLWLHNKLGTSNDSWTGGSIVSQLSSDILMKIQRCFQDLQPQVKLKLLLSFFQIPRRNLEQWKHELEEIIAVASDDSEPWVCMIAELIKTYPETGQLNCDISAPESNRKIFADLLVDLKKALKKSSDRQDLVMPLECPYLNKNAFVSLVGHQPQSARHFSLRRKPKAAALRADLLNKSQEAANKLKSNVSGGFPVRKLTMPRKMSDPSPLKGLPSRPLVGSGLRNPRVLIPSRNPGKKEGGVKLLDITEQPIGYAAAKKRKRQQEAEEAKKQAGELQSVKEAAAKDEAGESRSLLTSASAASTVNSTPDYAAGLNPATPAPGSVASATPAYAPPTPTPLQAPLLAQLPAPPAPPVYAPPTPAMQVSLTPVSVASVSAVAASAASLGPPSNLNPLPPQQVSVSSSSLASMSAVPVSLVQSTSAPRPTNTLFPVSLQSLEPLPPTSLPEMISVPPILTRVTALAQQPTAARIVQLPTQPIPQSRVAQIQTRAAPPPVALLTTRLARPEQQATALFQTLPRPISLGPPGTASTTATVVAPAPGPAPQRKPCTLTEEQKIEAMELFENANKVTRPEKALIVGFMGGSRDNPCPQLGNVVTIRLSENQEDVKQPDGTVARMNVETHFQMNYSTGEYRRIFRLQK